MFCCIWHGFKLFTKSLFCSELSRREKLHYILEIRQNIRCRTNTAYRKLEKQGSAGEKNEPSELESFFLLQFLLLWFTCYRAWWGKAVVCEGEGRGSWGAVAPCWPSFLPPPPPPCPTPSPAGTLSRTEWEAPAHIIKSLHFSIGVQIPEMQHVSKWIRKN